jgi:hypothetical protein
MPDTFKVTTPIQLRFRDTDMLSIESTSGRKGSLCYL